MTLPAEILDPIPQDQIPTAMRARWHQLVITNGEADRSMVAQGQYVPVRVPEGGVESVRVAGDAVRDPALDMTIPFDSSNPDHLAVMIALDKIIKTEYLARIASAPTE